MKQYIRYNSPKGKFDPLHVNFEEFQLVSILHYFLPFHCFFLKFDS